MLPVIHFSTLEELLDEFRFFGSRKQIVRVAAQQRSETKPGSVPYTLITVQVYARAIHQGAILSYVAMSEEIRIGPMFDRAEGKAKYDATWLDADLACASLRAEIRSAGHEAMPGVIDLGGVQPMVGQKWAASESEVNHG